MKTTDLLATKAKPKTGSILTIMGPQKDSYTGNFNCPAKVITSLEGAPSTVNGDFNCAGNKLTSLKSGPRIVTGVMYCDNNMIKSLEGAPSRIGSYFSIENNKLTSLHNIHKIIKHIGRNAYFNGNDITSHVLGLLLIDGLYEVFLAPKKVQNILNRHLNGDRDVFACQEELIEAGFDAFAQL